VKLDIGEVRRRSSLLAMASSGKLVEIEVEIQQQQHQSIFPKQVG
jgi:hypothetical protein